MPCHLLGAAVGWQKEAVSHTVAGRVAFGTALHWERGRGLLPEAEERRSCHTVMRREGLGISWCKEGALSHLRKWSPVKTCGRKGDHSETLGAAYSIAVCFCLF